MNHESNNIPPNASETFKKLPTYIGKEFSKLVDINTIAKVLKNSIEFLKKRYGNKFDYFDRSFQLSILNNEILLQQDGRLVLGHGKTFIYDSYLNIWSRYLKLQQENYQAVDFNYPDSQIEEIHIVLKIFHELFNIFNKMGIGRILTYKNIHGSTLLTEIDVKGELELFNDLYI